MKLVITFTVLFAFIVHGVTKAQAENNKECSYIVDMSQVVGSPRGNEDLDAAVKDSDPAAIRAAIWLGADPSKLVGTHWYEIGKRERLNVLLIAAVAANDLDKVNDLLARGADPNAHGHLDDIMTPLITASKCASPRMILMLIHSGAKINDHASYPGSSEEIIDNSSALIWASYRGDPKVVELLLKQGANPNNQEIISFLNDRSHKFSPGTTPLLTVPPLPVLQELLSSGARPNIADLNGETPLMLAAIQGSYEKCFLLLKYGADPRSKDVGGSTASDYARMSGHHDLACWINEWHPGAPRPINKKKSC